MRTSVWSILLLAAVAAHPLAGQTERGAFVVTLGKDTVVIEQYNRTRTTITGDMLIRGAIVTQRHYEGTLNADGSMARFDMTNRNAGNPQAPITRFVATFGDTTIVEVQRDTVHNQLKVATPGGALPFINISYAMYELYGRRARATGKDTIVTLSMGANDVTRLVVKHPSRDSLTVAFEDDPPTLFTVNSDGLIQTVDGKLTTQKYLSKRLASVDWTALVTAFAAKPLGQLSPPDSVRTTVGGVAIAINYGRPSIRGRPAFGPDTDSPRPIVIWNQVWRTGANFATRFTNSADLVVGGQTIPAGTYTLWTIPSPSGWKLIFNKQTKAPCPAVGPCDPNRANLWGTDYSADSDFVRVDMQVAAIDTPVEKFIITVEPQGDGAVMAFAWEKRRASVMLAKK
jgi:hypothetical protein